MAGLPHPSFLYIFFFCKNFQIAKFLKFEYNGLQNIMQPKSPKNFTVKSYDTKQKQEEFPITLFNL